MNRLHTSIRAAAPEATLKLAKAWAGMARIRAVTDITNLDCLGVPIFVSERERALSDGFAFGKGLAAIESEIGAHMEAIESHFAEPGVAALETRWGTPGDLDSGPDGGDPIFDLAPIAARRARSDARLLLVRAHDAESGAPAWVPAELVYFPAPDVGGEIFGASSNGLASGNSIAEASLHALFELIERDIWSVEFVRNASLRVSEQSLPLEARKIAERAASHGLRFVVRTVPNDFGMPFFAVFLFDPRRPEQRFFNGGWGCHLERRIALSRAVTEAAQSRAAFLHGGRDAPPWDGEGAESDAIRSQAAMVSRDTPSISFGEVDEPASAGSIAGQWDAAVRCLRRVVDRPIYRVVYTPHEGPLHVVRLIVPGLENFSKETMRVGPRLQAALETDADAAA